MENREIAQKVIELIGGKRISNPLPTVPQDCV